MKKITFLFIVSFLCFSAYAQENLLETAGKNPSLNAKDASDLSQGCWWWSGYQTGLGGNMVAATPGQGNDDTSCGKVEFNGALDASTFKWGAQHQWIDITSGVAHTCSYWIKSDTDAKVIGIRVNYDTDGASNWEGATGKETTVDIADGWVFDSFVFPADAQANNGSAPTALKIIACGASTTGAFYIDNVSLYEGTATSINKTEVEKLRVSVAPDGSKLALFGDLNSVVEIYGVTGSLLIQTNVIGQNPMVDISGLNRGNIYIAKVGDQIVKFVK
ncbi:hypothetical protein [Carboxylicivirga marina]|uniref:Secretion system C-terminal sorting domain-containing protein n=1 Tax=Carboxylicivirga marina TaxID=2800988 RepID=A0ABS1HEL8_9BACT|nr:hypothetical protein [Carboxylicivirga marina]MBK3516071.1 hypothetical protein [Carboxylicivirga marina]